MSRSKPDLDWQDIQGQIVTCCSSSQPCQLNHFLLWQAHDSVKVSWEQFHVNIWNLHQFYNCFQTYRLSSPSDPLHHRPHRYNSPGSLDWCCWSQTGHWKRSAPSSRCPPLSPRPPGTGKVGRLSSGDHSVLSLSSSLSATNQQCTYNTVYRKSKI